MKKLLFTSQLLDERKTLLVKKADALLVKMIPPTNNCPTKDCKRLAQDPPTNDSRIGHVDMS